MINLNLNWTPWRPLKGSTTEKSFPESPGLYRIRRTGQEHLDYLGQTGRALRKRLADLRGVHGSEIPFRDPHTAGPGLWALLHQGGRELEVSVTAVEGDDQFRKAVEAAVISLHREQFGFSPTINFGRMPQGYAMSTDRKRGQRGGVCTDELYCHLPGVPVNGSLASWGSPSWCGYTWSPWQPLANMPKLVPANANGLYIIRNAEELLYIGQGLLRQRLTAHSRKPADHVQGRFFQMPGVECSWVVLPEGSSNQLQELENDLIASYLLNTEKVPRAQFLGDRAF